VPGSHDSLKTKDISVWADMPEMQEHFPAGAWMARQPENEGHFLFEPTCRKCRSNFRHLPGWHEYEKNQGAFPQLVSEDPDDRAPFREI